MASRRVLQQSFIPPHTVIFRYLTKNDLDAMLQYINTLIQEDTYIGLCGKPLTRTYERSYLHKSLKAMKENNECHVVVEIDGHYGGSADIVRNSLPRKNHVGTLSVALLSQYRDKGIGTLLLKHMIQEAKRMHIDILELTCFENNKRALHMYMKLGFKKVGIIPKAILFKGAYIGEIVLYLPIVTP